MLKTLYYLPTFYKNQYKSLKVLKKLQEKRLKYVVNFAYRNTVLYKEKFKKAGITPADIQTLDDITKIPVTTKEEIKAGYPHESVAPGYTEQNCIVEHTSGSSGNMLKVLYNPDASERFRAIAFRDYLAQGVRPWHMFCIMGRDPVEIERATKSILYRTCGILEGRPERELVEELRVIQPDIIGAHPSLLAAMAKVIEEKGYTLHPRLLLLGGEVAYPHVREYIEKIFCCPTRDKYGAYEMLSIAWECTCQNMHINVDAAIVEVLRDGAPVAPGERGEIVATNLWNKAMPFIRYRLGDIGIPSDETCACGRGLPLLQEIEGKFDDFIVLPSGDIVPSTRVVPFFFIVPCIEQFKMIQDKKAHIIVRIVPQKGFTVDMEKTLVQNIQTVLGESVDVEIEKVDHINHRGAGKFKRVQRTFAANLPFEGG
jgi:phenylacetate-CoA ligase